MPALADLDVLVVDCQTTGASPAFGHVLEMGWGIARGGAPDRLDPAEAHWIVLPEHHPVPGQVRKLTGYDPSAAAGVAIADREAWRRLRRAAGQAATGDAVPIPTAIHFARFELAFLREWSSRLEPEAAFPLDAVCVYEIANRLFPALPRLSLRALAGHLGHSLHLVRRSLGHVEATAFVWRRLCERLVARRIDSWEDLRSWLAERAPARRRPSKATYPIDRERYRSLPDAPGVYRFLRSNGDVLYVGKAASLRKRTASHFLARTSKPLAPEMLTQVSDIAVTVALSALEAALLENETIKLLRPPYNVQLAPGDPRVWYAAHDFADAAPSPTNAHRIGPLPAEYSLLPLAALVDLVAAGAAVDPRTRAHAVGISALWPPDAGVFAAGWAEVAGRYADELTAVSASGVGGSDEENSRSQALWLARRILAAAATAETDVDRADAEGGGGAGGSDCSSGAIDRAWTPERVARHIERACAQAFRTYRRARWLRLLHTCDITYREPDAPNVLRLEVRDAEIAAPRDTRPAPPVAPRLTSEGTAPRFDRGRYDRLRILTTELKRILRDGGDVAVFLRGRTQPLAGVRLRGVFQVI